MPPLQIALGGLDMPKSPNRHEKELHHSTRLAWDNGLLCGCVATLIFSFSSLQVKLTGGRVPVLELCIIRSCISWCTSIAVGTASRISPLFGHRQHFRLLFLRGLFGTLAITTSYIALLTLPLGDAVTVAQMRPPVTAVMARLLLSEPLGVQGLLGCLVSVVGVTVLAHPPFLFGGHENWGRSRLLGTACGVLSTLFASGTSYCVRRIGTKEPALVGALYFHTVTIALMAPPLLLGIPEAAKPLARVDCLLLLGIAASSFCAQLLMTRSFQLIPAARAAAVSFMGVVYSHILGWLIFHEHLTSTTLLGGVLIFAGVLLVTLKPHKAALATDKMDTADTAAAASAESPDESESRQAAGAAAGAAAAAGLSSSSAGVIDAAEDGDGQGRGEMQRLLNHGQAEPPTGGSDRSTVSMAAAGTASSRSLWPSTWLRQLLSKLSRSRTQPEASSTRLLPVASSVDLSSSFACQQGPCPGHSGYSAFGGSTADSINRPLLSVTSQQSWTSAADPAQEQQLIDAAWCSDSSGVQAAAELELLEGHRVSEMLLQRPPQ